MQSSITIDEDFGFFFDTLLHCPDIQLQLVPHTLQLVFNSSLLFKNDQEPPFAPTMQSSITIDEYFGFFFDTLLHCPDIQLQPVPYTLQLVFNLSLLFKNDQEPPFARLITYV